MICASVSSSTVTGMLAMARAAIARGAEAVEFRIDALDSPSMEEVLSLSSVEAFTVATFKGKSLWLLEGDGMRGIFSSFDHVDLEASEAERMDVPDEFKDRLLLSYHGRISSVADAGKLISAGLNSAGIVKCVGTADGYASSMIPCLASDAHPGDRQRIVTFSMGEEGTLSRIRSMRSGSPVSYACVAPENRTAPGQLTVEEMLLAREGIVLGIAGSPRAASHSLSPAIHSALMSDAGIKGVYLRFPVRNGELPAFFDSSKYAGVLGFNVTMPFKEDAFRLVDSADGASEEIGAVNTVCSADGKLRGYNTDVIAISEIVAELRPRTALIFGSGGAARAAAYSLKGKGVSIEARNCAKRNRLIRDFGLELFDGRAGSYDLLVNCTPAGMEGTVVDIPASVTECSYRAVIDFVYSEGTLPFDRVASSAGARYIGGLEVLARQAVHSFFLWTGREAGADRVISMLGGVRREA